MDGAPPHFHNDVKNYFLNHFPYRWIGCQAEKYNGLKNWCPRSPDLTPLDFFLWGYVKSECYKLAPQNIEELKQAIELCFSKITVKMLENVKNNWESRLQHLIAIDGEQFEDIV